MYKKILSAITVFTIAGCILTGCRKGVKTDDTAAPDGTQVQTSIDDEKDDDRDEKMTESEIIDFMVEQYGFSREELKGINVVSFFEDYRLDEYDYTAEEIRQILEDERSSYLLTEEDMIDTLLGKTDDIPATGTDLTTGADITRVAYYKNPGSLQTKYYFDIDKGICCVNGVPGSIRIEDTNSIKSIPSKTGISEWDHLYIEDGGQNTTGSFAWKLVFELRSGERCVYGGFTRDMKNLPDDFDQVTQILETAGKRAVQE